MEPTKSAQPSPSVTNAPLSAISVEEALHCARKAVVHDHANDPEEVQKRERPRPTPEELQALTDLQTELASDSTEIATAITTNTPTQ